MLLSVSVVCWRFKVGLGEATRLQGRADMRVNGQPLVTYRVVTVQGCKPNVNRAPPASESTSQMGCRWTGGGAKSAMSSESSLASCPQVLGLGKFQQHLALKKGQREGWGMDGRMGGAPTSLCKSVTNSMLSTTNNGIKL